MRRPMLNNSAPGQAVYDPFLGSGIRASGITSLAAIAEALNARCIPTARGGRWHVSTVRNALRRQGGAGASF